MKMPMEMTLDEAILHCELEVEANDIGGNNGD